MPTINFKGKSAIWNHHLSVPYQILEKDKKLSVRGKNEDENLIIEADNLIALKSLLPKYQGKIKCIYIDPPYNTGNEGWIYNDSVNNPLIKSWIGKSVGADDLTRHEKWLCMMTPRLKLLYELLSDDGLIFISIDDNEIHHLFQLMEEIFTENNFQSLVSWRRRMNQPNDETKMIAKVSEYIIVYAKKAEILKDRKSFNKMPLSEKRLAAYSNPDNDLRGDWSSTPWCASKGQGGTKYKITTPTGNVYEETWLGTEETFNNLFKDNRIIFPNKGKGKPRKKIFKSEALKNGQSAINFWVGDKYGNNLLATSELKNIFGISNLFDHPKPSNLIKAIIEIACDKDSIILDSFAGSGTTAQAVLEANKEDGGNRKFILIQLPEEIKENTPAYKAGFRYVHEITQERVKKVIEKDELDAGFSYMRLGPAIDADSILSGMLPTYREFAKYVYYLATGETMESEKSIDEKSYFVGKNKNEAIYLIYQKDKDKLKNMAINLDWAEEVNKKDKGRKIVYAPACFLDEEYLEKFNMQFVSVPYNLFEKK